MGDPHHPDIEIVEVGAVVGERVERRDPYGDRDRLAGQLRVVPGFVVSSQGGGVPTWWSFSISR